MKITTAMTIDQMIMGAVTFPRARFLTWTKTALTPHNLAKGPTARPFFACTLHP
jgi:hypothetical protein